MIGRPERSGEFDLIARYFAPLAGKGSSDLKDDAAHFTPDPGYDLVITQDAILEGVHFFPDDRPEDVARKALRVNISDLVAKGAEARTYSLALGIPDDWADADVENFAAGLASDQDRYGTTLTGGDTYRSPDRLCVSTTMLGRVPEGGYVSRIGAKSGNVIAVTGVIGDAVLGLYLREGGHLNVSDEDREFLLGRQAVPEPPIKIGPIVSRFASSSMDISDGLLGDLAKLCRASGASAEIDWRRVPLSTAARRVIADHAQEEAVFAERMLTGGDDYQTMMTVPVGDWQKCQALAEREVVPLTAIGTIRDGKPGEVGVFAGDVPMSIDAGSYSHF